MGDLPNVREGFAAVISAAKCAWWWRPLQQIAKENKKTVDVVRSVL